MLKVSVLYPNRAGTKFDMAYYLNHHIPLVRQLLGSALKAVSVEHGISGEEPGSPAPYVTTCHLLLDSVQAYQTSFGPHVQEIIEDIPKYTDSQPLIQLGEVQALAMATMGGCFRKRQSARDPEVVGLCAR